MAKVQDTYNPVTGEYVKRISDWVNLDGNLAWLSSYNDNKPNYKWVRTVRSTTLPNYLNSEVICTKYDTSRINFSLSAEVWSESTYPDYIYGWAGDNFYLSVNDIDSGWGSSLTPSTPEVKAYFHGWRMCNSDSTSPYYKSEVPYTPATWAEWTKNSLITVDSTGMNYTADGVTYGTARMTNPPVWKTSQKYGLLYNIVNASGLQLYLDISGPIIGMEQTYLQAVAGNGKNIFTTAPSISSNSLIFVSPVSTVGKNIKIKDIRIFELPAGSQIETDFNNLSADELSAKYTFNGLCIKHWKKVTDGTGLTSTLPTASYAGYTPYKMIYQLATPEISYLTPKATIPLYDTNTIVETDTPSDCKADVTVGYKLKDGVTAVDGDITAPTPDYMSAVNSVSEDGLGKGIVRGKNLFDINTASIPIGTAYASVNISNNSITISSKNNVHIRQKMNIKPNTNYVVKCNYTGTPNIQLRIRRSNIVLISYSPLQPLSTGSIWNSGGYSGEMWFELYYNEASLTTTVISNIQIEEGTTIATTYEPYKNTQTILPTLRKIGTVADTYNPETGVYVQRIGKKVFDGTETGWSEPSTNTATGISRFFIYDSSFSNKSAYISSSYNQALSVKCSHFLAISHDATDTRLVEGVGFAPDTFRMSLKKVSTTSQFKAYLVEQYAKGTPVTVYYQLATPVVTTLTPTALPSYSPTTVIESDSTVKGNVSADYKLKKGATSVAGDFIASPESVNPIIDLGESIDVVSSAGRRNLLKKTNGLLPISSNNHALYPSSYTIMSEGGREFCRIRRTSFELNPTTMSLYSGAAKNIIDSSAFDSGEITVSYKARASQNVQANTMYVTYGSGVITGFPNSQISITTEWQTFYTTFSNLPSATTDGIRVNPLGILGLTAEEMTNFYLDLCEWKIEKGNQYSNHTQYPEIVPYEMTTNGLYKTNILLSNPLRSLGTVKDRLFKDSDGKWKVERNVGKKVFDGSEVWTNSPDTNWNKDTNYFQSEILLSNMALTTDSPIISNVLTSETFNNLYGWTTKREAMASHSSGRIIVMIDRKRLSSPTVGAIAAWAGANNLTVNYQLATPTYETLSQELQTKLDNIPTFPDNNYVYTVANLEPMLHVDYKKLAWSKSCLLLNSLKIYSRNLTEEEMIQNYKIEKERFGM